MSASAVNKDFPPDDDDAQEQLVRELFDAMVNCDTARQRLIDRWQGRSHYSLFQDNAPRQIFKVQRVPKLMLELLAWDLLAAINRAQEVNIPVNLNGNKIVPYPTFRDRFDKVKVALLESKVFVDYLDNMMEEDFIYKLATAPELGFD